MSRARQLAVSSVAAVVCGALALGVAACGSSGSSSGSSSSSSGGKQLKNVAVSMYARDNPFFAEVVSGIRYEAKRAGVNVDVTYAENDPSQQVNQIQNLITRHPDGLVVSPIDQNALVPPVQQAHTAGIPVVTVTDNIAQSGQSSLLAYLGNDYTDTGVKKAQFIVNQLHGKGTVGVIHLIRGLAFTEEQWSGAKTVFQKNPGIKIVGELYAGGASRDLGLKDAQNLLTANPGLSALYVDNDDLALGALQAVAQRHIPMNKIVVVGANGTPDALSSIKAGKLDLTVNFCGFNQGVRAIDALKHYVQSGAKPTGASPQEVITAANIASMQAKLAKGCSGPA